MTQQRSTNRMENSGLNELHKKQPRRLAAVVAVVALFWIGLVLLASYRQTEMRPASSGARKESAHSAQATPTPQLSERAVKDTAWDPAWPPLPNAGMPAQPIDQVRAMYAFAARHPEVLQYAPCYCGCESGGHQNVRDCFVKGRDANGKPQWDGMGFI